MIEAVRNYIGLFEDIEPSDPINVEYLPSEPTSYSLVEEPLFNGGVLNTFLNGIQRKEFRVQLQRVTHYEEPVATNISNSKFMKRFESWIQDNNKNRVFPAIEGIQEVKITTSGYLQAVSSDQTHAVYVVSLQFIYIR